MTVLEDCAWHAWSMEVLGCCMVDHTIATGWYTSVYNAVIKLQIGVAQVCRPT